MLIVHQSKYHFQKFPFLNIRFRVLGFFTHSLTNPILENDIMTSSTIASLSAKAPHSLLSWAYQLPAVAFPNSNNILLLSASIQHSLVDWFWWKWKLKSADEGTNCRFWEGWSLGVSAGFTPSKSEFCGCIKSIQKHSWHHTSSRTQLLKLQHLDLAKDSSRQPSGTQIFDTASPSESIPSNRG